jgi:hypothetical protein
MLCGQQACQSWEGISRFEDKDVARELRAAAIEEAKSEMWWVRLKGRKLHYARPRFLKAMEPT